MNRKIYDDYSVNSRDPEVEINNHYLPRKDITVSSPLSSPMMVRKREMHSHGGSETNIQNEILRLKHYQQIEHQRLIEKYQQEQNQLAAMHEKQLEEHLKVRQHMLMLQKQQEFLEQQRKLEEQHRLEQKMQEEKLMQIKNKSLEQQSAIASVAVKQKLQEFVLNKKQREAAVNNIRNSSQFRWAHHSSLDQSSPPSASLSPPYRPHLLGQFDELNQLRRTASEPNLKVRSVLKQKVIERRSSPLIQKRKKYRLRL